MRSKLKRSQPDTGKLGASGESGADIDSKLDSLLGDSTGREGEGTDQVANDAAPMMSADRDDAALDDATDAADGATDAADATDDGGDAAAPPADTAAGQQPVESVASGAKGKPSRRGKSQARLDRRVDDAVRSIVNLYEFKTSEPMYSTIAVVSALPGEGVSTMVDGFARVLAEDFDTAVCIVDTNPSRGVGIYEMLTEDTELDEALIDEGAGVFRLKLGQMPAGSRNSIFRSPKWADLVKDLTNEFGHCIFDTAPLLGRGNTLAILRHVDAHVLVTRYGATSSAQVKSVANELRIQPRLGSVLNGFQTKTPAFIRRFFSE